MISKNKSKYFEIIDQKLKYHFTINLNSLAENIKKAAPLWLEQMGLIASIKDNQFPENKSAYLMAAYCFPKAPYTLLLLFTNYLDWISLFNIHHGKNKSEEFMYMNVKRYMKIINYLETEDNSPECMSLSIIMYKLYSYADDSWIMRFKKHMGEFFQCRIRERHYQEIHRSPTMSEYLELRLTTSGMHILFDFIELNLSENLPARFEKSIVFQKIRDLSSDIYAWSSDIFCLINDSENTNPCNLIKVLMNEYTLSVDESVLKAITMRNHLLSEFLAIEAEIKTIYAVNENDALSLWIDGLKDIIIGSWQWNIESKEQENSNSFDFKNSVVNLQKSDAI